MKRKIFLLSLIAINVSVVYGQDINFSQFYELPLLRNPSLAGTYRGDIRVTTAFRSQWNSVTVPYQTQALGVETKFGLGPESGDYISMGIQLTNDVAGDSKMGKTQVLPMLTYHKLVSADNDSYISVGFLGGPVLQRFDPTKLSFSDQFVNGAYLPTNPTRQTFSKTNNTYWDAAAGVTYSSVLGTETKYYVGVAWFHVNKPKVAFNPSNDIQLNRKWVFNGGLSTPTSESDRLIFYVDHFAQGGNSQTQGGIILRHNLVQEDEDLGVDISAGVFYRWNDAIIPVIKLGYYSFNLGLTYDTNISKLKTASQSRGGFEVTLSYNSFLNIRNSSLQKVRCPVAL
ncbi:MAG: PorP/SprF family type IX secretion system membrane protein [Chitinophagaceae bacterium]